MHGVDPEPSEPAMELDQDACYRALQTRDPRFDGRFFTGVSSTGIYCRPICPARTPKRSNCVFLPCAAAAQEAGFRPCLRCRPESSPGTPAWGGTSTTVKRGLRLIDAGALDTGDVAQLAARLGVGERHLRRLFVSHVGASPQAIALTRRVAFAKQLINETDLGMSDIAFSSGFSSIRRFNDAMLNTYRRPPRELRRSRRAARADKGESPAGASAGSRLSLRLPYRPPLHWRGLLRNLARDSDPSVARADGESYLRTFRLPGNTGGVGGTGHTDGTDEAVGRVRVRVADTAETAKSGHYLVAELELSHPGGLIRIADRLRRMFDLHADPGEIETVLATDPLLERRLRERPGIRIPGAWDPFEFAVTALVLGPCPGPTARNRLAALVAQCGSDLLLPSGTSSEGAAWPTRLFPTPEALAGQSLERLGLPTPTLRALCALSSAVANGSATFATEVGQDGAPGYDSLRLLPGLDASTLERIALRALGNPDAFPANDSRLRGALSSAASPRPSPAALTQRAEQWRPWRGYAAMLLWDALD